MLTSSGLVANCEGQVCTEWLPAVGGTTGDGAVLVCRTTWPSEVTGEFGCPPIAAATMAAAAAAEAAEPTATEVAFPAVGGGDEAVLRPTPPPAGTGVPPRVQPPPPPPPRLAICSVGVEPEVDSEEAEPTEPERPRPTAGGGTDKFAGLEAMLTFVKDR